MRRVLLRFAIVLLVAGLGYGLWLDHRIHTQFEGRRWSLPARLYARPLEIYPGLRLSAAQVRRELKLLGYRARADLTRPGTYAGKGSTLTLHTRRFGFWDQEEPERRLRLSFSAGTLIRVTDSRGEPVALARLDPLLIGRIYPQHNEDRILVHLDEVPPALIEALRVTEDRKFRQHHGLDPWGIMRALWANFRAGRTVQGGSTLTQQLVKNYFLTGERSLTRKLNEAVMALILEWRYDKDEILEAYLNEVYLGQQGAHGIHGFGQAAHFYFGRPVDELKLPEVALLVALVRGASYYNPRKHPERARGRRDLVIGELERGGIINPEQAASARRAPLGVTPKPSAAASQYPAFIELARRQLRRDYAEEDLRSEGLRVFTTLDPLAQEAAEHALSSRIRKLESSRPRAQAGLQGAALILGVETGEVQAVVGGREPRDEGFNRALNARRQVGSLIKPAVYLTALERNGGYTLASLIKDEPIRIQGPRGDIWAPRNYDQKVHGEVSLISALARSYNLATVQLGMQLGLHKVLHTLRRLGVTRDLPAYPSLFLGAASLTPLEVAQMYETIASGGFRIPPRAIREVTGPEGRPLSRYRLSVDQAVRPGPAYLIGIALREAFRAGTGRSVYKRLRGNPALAGKTGTTDELRDSWFAGFGEQRLAVVWIGRDDAKPAGLTGAQGALQVWGDVMQALAARSWTGTPPDTVEWQWVDPDRGALTAPDCPGAQRLPFLKGSEPGYVPC